MYLLDTDTLSEMKKIKGGRADAGVVAWASAFRGSAWLSAITILEIEKGILQLARRDTMQAERLNSWLEGQVLPRFEGRILPFGLAEARLCASLHVPDPRPERDAMIAATALVNGLTVVTRNVRDFAPMGASVFNPWDEA